MPESEPNSGNDGLSNHGIVVRSANVDVFVSTAVSCICNTGTDKVDGHFQKLYHETSSPFFPLWYYYLIDNIQILVEE